MVDGFKVAEDIRATDPEAFEMLTTRLQPDQEFCLVEKDTTQTLNASLCVLGPGQHPQPRHHDAQVGPAAVFSSTVWEKP